jgi:hypothetical protein
MLEIESKRLICRLEAGIGVVVAIFDERLFAILLSYDVCPFVGKEKEKKFIGSQRWRRLTIDALKRTTR